MQATKKCFYCKTEFTGKYFMYAIEHPYINLWFCWKCFSDLNYNGLTEFILNNINKIS